MDSRAARSVFGILLVFLLLLGCSAPITLTAPSEAPTGQLPDDERTLSSLQQVDEYPLYLMRYYGAYQTAGIPHFLDGAHASTLAGHLWGCSLFAALGDANNMLYGRNFDWQYSPALLLFTDPPDGNASVSMVDIAYLGFDGARAKTLLDLPLAERRSLLDAPQLPFDGMNERGLVVGMAAVPPGNMTPDPTKPTTDSLMIIREMLDHAGTVEEAAALLQRYNLEYGSGPPLHYLIADSTGHAVLVEFYNGKTYMMANETKWHLATNFLRSSVKNSGGQCWRYDRIEERLRQDDGYSTLPDALDLLQAVAQDNTQWSIAYGISSGDIVVTMGRRFNRVHKFNLEMVRP